MIQLWQAVGGTIQSVWKRQKQKDQSCTGIHQNNGYQVIAGAHLGKQTCHKLWEQVLSDQ